LPEGEANPDTTQWLLASRKLNNMTRARGRRRQRMVSMDRNILLGIVGIFC